MFKRLLSYVVVAFIALSIGSAFQPFAHLSTSAQAGCQTFPQTGKTVCGKFLAYWNGNGGLAQQGYPITNQFTEVSELNGQPYSVQYFERAVFELHPENAGTRYEVLLSQLGKFQFDRKYAGVDPSASPAPTSPPASQRCGAICNDGTRSDATGSGACSHHGGVKEWLYCP